jgi:hypothetical protein
VVKGTSLGLDNYRYYLIQYESQAFLKNRGKNVRLRI